MAKKTDKPPSGRRVKAQEHIDIGAQRRRDTRRDGEARQKFLLIYENLYSNAYENCMADAATKRKPLGDGLTAQDWGHESPEIHAVNMGMSDAIYGHSKKSPRQFAEALAERGGLVDQDGKMISFGDVGNYKWN